MNDKVLVPVEFCLRCGRSRELYNKGDRGPCSVYGKTFSRHMWGYPDPPDETDCD